MTDYIHVLDELVNVLAAVGIMVAMIVIFLFLMFYFGNAGAAVAPAMANVTIAPDEIVICQQIVKSEKGGDSSTKGIECFMVQKEKSSEEKTASDIRDELEKMDNNKK